MSRVIYAGDNLVVGTFAGPAAEGPNRRRWQFTIRDGGDVAVLTDSELREFVYGLLQATGDPAFEVTT